MSSEFDLKYMDIAIENAHTAYKNNEIPVGCVIAHKTKPIFFSSYNSIEQKFNPLLHAEINAINIALKSLKTKYLYDFNIYVTLEPCMMCAMAISLSRISTVYFAAFNHKSGAFYNKHNIFNFKECIHKPEIIGGIREKESEKILNKFFQNKR